MAVNKPTRPDSELPETWGGTQYPYTEEEVENGYLETVPQIIDGGKLNYQMKGIFERLKYTTAIADVINNTPIGQVVAVDSNNKFDYKVLPVIATNEEYRDGSSNTVIPSVKQIKDNVVDLSGAQTITGNKTFAGTTTLSGLNINGLTTTTNDIKRTINLDVTTPPDSNTYIIPFTVNNGDESLKAYQQIGYFPNGTLQNTIGLRRNVNGTNIFNTIDLGIDSAGNRTAYVTTPESNSNGQNIATTAWVNTKLNNYYISENIGYLRFPNGIQMVWGVSSTGTTVNYPLAFKTVYSIIVSPAGDGTKFAYYSNFSNTNFKINASGSGTITVSYLVVGSWK